MTHRTVAAIVPVYNRPGLVLEALASIASQTLPPTRLIVVDDGSTDDTAQRVGQWFKAANLAFGTQLLRQPNAGCGPARNRGAIEAAGCELLAFLDSDDLWPSDYLQRMTNAIGSHDDAVAASCDRKVTFPSSARDYLLCARTLDGMVTAELFDGYCPNASSTLITAAAFDRVGGFDARWQFFEDQDLFLRLSLLGTWVYVPGDPVVFRQEMYTAVGGPVNMTDRMNTAEATLLQKQLFERFLDEQGGRAAIPVRRQRRRLSQMWHKAGKQWLKQGRPDEALRCFAGAMKINPCNHRALVRWGQAQVSRLFSRRGSGRTDRPAC